MAVIGNVRGGLLQVIVVTIFLIWGVSGSKVADVAAIGPVVRGNEKARLRGGRGRRRARRLRRDVRDHSTQHRHAGAGSVTPISIGTLFIAGILPAVVIAHLPDGADLCAGAPVRPHRHEPLSGSRRSIARHPRRNPAADHAGGDGDGHQVRHRHADRGILARRDLWHRPLGVRLSRDAARAPMLRLAGECSGSAGMVLFVLSSASAFAWVLTPPTCRRTWCGCLARWDGAGAVHGGIGGAADRDRFVAGGVAGADHPGPVAAADRRTYGR